MAPTVRIDGAGLAWALGRRPVDAITSEAVEVVMSSGHMLRCYKPTAAARRVSVLAWDAGVGLRAVPVCFEKRSEMVV